MKSLHVLGVDAVVDIRVHVRPRPASCSFGPPQCVSQPSAGGARGPSRASAHHLAERVEGGLRERACARLQQRGVGGLPAAQHLLHLRGELCAGRLLASGGAHHSEHLRQERAVGVHRRLRRCAAEQRAEAVERRLRLLLVRAAQRQRRQEERHQLRRDAGRLEMPHAVSQQPSDREHGALGAALVVGAARVARLHERAQLARGIGGRAAREQLAAVLGDDA